MKCPHCMVGIHESFTPVKVADFSAMSHKDGWTIPARSVTVYHQICPECKGIIVKLLMNIQGQSPQMFLVYPKGATRPVAPEVIDPYRSDFTEASLVLPDSPKASAALSRRCLQMVLRDIAKVKASNLSKEIDEVIGSLPSHLAGAVDGVRNYGNFAAHPMKSTNTGEIVDVEPGEAEWLLDTLEGLFDFYFVQPAILKKKREDLNKKLAETGKPPMK